MEKLRKRHASRELQSLSSSVLLDYKLFTNFDTIFQSAKEKRTRYDDSYYATQITGARPQWRQGESMVTESEFSKIRSGSFVFQERNEIGTSLSVQKDHVIAKSTRIGWNKQPPFDPTTSPHEVEMHNKKKMGRLQASKDALKKAMNNLEEKDLEKTKRASTKTNNIFEDMAKIRMQNTQIIFSSDSEESHPYEKVFLSHDNEKFANDEAWENLNKVRAQQSRGVSTYGDRSINLSNDQPITIIVDDDMTAVPTNEKSVNKESSQVSPVQREASSSSNSSSPDHMSFSPNMDIPLDYVITKVGSLLWLDKEMIYPITLAEIRRRVKDPENFSFQMLIAYVRHSRAKGRQFLSFWNCLPSGRTSKPNVLSKLCEGDAEQLFEGIKNVNEKFFPTEKVAENAAETMKTKGNYGSAQSLKEKFERIQKSRSVLQQLDEVLTEKQESEKFDAFNIATHNIGLANIKYTLKFLGNIFQSVQNKIECNKKT